MDCLHGVLMHDDSKTGEGHEAEHAYDRLKEQDAARERQKEQTGPCQGMDCVHEMLMHGGEGTEGEGGGVRRMEQHESIGQHEQPAASFAVNPDAALHDADHGAHDSQSGQGHAHASESSQGTPGTYDPDRLLHENEGEHEGHESVGTTKGQNIPGTYDPDQLLHNGENHHAHVHRETDTESTLGTNQGTPGIYDPDRMLHGGDEEHGDGGHEHHMHGGSSGKGVVGVEPPINIPETESRSFLGYSFDYVSDTILDNVDLLKLRYLKRFWSAPEQPAEQQPQQQENRHQHEHLQRDTEGDTKDDLRDLYM